MAGYRNIQEYRRKKRLKLLLRNVLIAVAILGVLFLLLYVFNVFKGSPLERFFSLHREDAADRFPVTIKTEQLVGMEDAGGDLAVLTRSSVMIYDTTGERKTILSHGYTNPVMKTSEKRILTYDRGGTRLRLDTTSGSIREITTDTPILTAELSPEGKVVVATSYRASVYNILVYDENLSLLFRKMTTTDYTSLAFSDDETHVALGSIDSPAGILETELSILDRTNETSVQTIEVSDILPVKIGYLSDGLVVAGKDSAVCVDLRSGKQTRMNYPGDLERLDLVPEKALLLVNEDPFSAYSVLTLLTGSGEVKTAELTDDVLDLYCDGEQVCVLMKNSVAHYDMSLKKLGEYPLSKSCQKLIRIDGNAYLMGSDSIEKLALDAR